MSNKNPSQPAQRCQSCLLRLDYIIKQMKQLKSAIYNTKKVLNFKEAREYTGLSNSQLYKLTRNNQIPCHRPSGRLIYFDKDELDKWLCEDKSENA